MYPYPAVRVGSLTPLSVTVELAMLMLPVPAESGVARIPFWLPQNASWFSTRVPDW